MLRLDILAEISIDESVEIDYRLLGVGILGESVAREQQGNRFNVCVKTYCVLTHTFKPGLGEVAIQA